MAAAGPAGNLLVALGAFAAMKIGLAAGWFIAPDRVTFDSAVELERAAGPMFIASFLSVPLVMNVFLAAFNLLPLPPLDGSAVLYALLPPRHADQFRELQANAMMSMVGLLVAWRVFPLFTDPLFSMVLRVLHPDSSYS